MLVLRSFSVAVQEFTEQCVKLHGPARSADLYALRQLTVPGQAFMKKCATAGGDVGRTELKDLAAHVQRVPCSDKDKHSKQLNLVLDFQKRA